MGEIKDSEAYSGLHDLFLKYKKFSFDVLAKVPYSQVPAWIAFSDGRVEEALKEKRGVVESLKDAYALSILGILASLVAFWYMWLFVGAVMLFLLGILGFVGMLLNPLWTIAAIAALIIGALIWPGAVNLARAAFYHIVMKLFGGKGSYSDTLRVMVLSSAGHLALMIPIFAAYAVIVGFILGPLAYVITIYVLYLQYRGMKHVHGMEPKNAAIATIVALVLEIGAYMTIYFASYVAMMLLSMSYS